MPPELSSCVCLLLADHELCSDPLAEVEDAYFAASKEWLSSLADGETVEDPKITYTGTPRRRLSA